MKLNGAKFSSKPNMVCGEVTIASSWGTSDPLIIEHDLGVIPTTFILMPKNHNVVFPHWSIIGYTGFNFLYWKAGDGIRYEDYYYDKQIASITKTKSSVVITPEYYQITIPHATFCWVAIA